MQEEQGFSVISAFMDFAELGAEWVMWLMIFMGFVGIVLMVERARLFLFTKIDAPALGRELVKALQDGDLASARSRVAKGQAMEERVLADALEAYPRGVFAVEQVMISSLARERQRYDRFLSYFGTVGSNAPFIGLFGTVIGIILAFKALGANPKGGLEVVGPAIAEALVATAVGLLIAIPAVIAFNFFKGLIRVRVGNVEFLVRILLAQIGGAREEG